MNAHSTLFQRGIRLVPATLASLSLCLSSAAPSVQAQAVPAGIVMAGSYQNFDVLNNTGAPTEGFEMDVYGVSKSQLTRIFPSNFNASVIRYGFGTATDIPGGVTVRWAANYDPATGTWSTSTPVPPSLTTVPGDSCWTLGMPSTYQTAGCEHFGISSIVNPTGITYHWLVPDPVNPGTLMTNNTYVNIPAPVWVAQPPANPALPPVVQAVVVAPVPPAPAVFGDAEWVKVYKTEQPGKVDLDQLVGDNHQVVPEGAAQLETNWSLLQQDPPNGGKQKQKGKLVNQGNLGNGDHAVVRRYEYYKYAGVYDPITHEALCADLTCTAPSPGELGDAIGAQNAAANLNVNALSVTSNNFGQVSSSDNIFSCGTRCYGVYTPGTVVTLTARPNSGALFGGWGGACSGNATTCTVTMNAESSVSASFLATYTLSIGLSNPGNVTSAPAGINCGSTCSAKFAAGSTVALTATPPAGQTFLGWSGACSGVDPNGCTVTMTANTSVKASFSK